MSQSPEASQRSLHPAVAIAAGLAAVTAVGIGAHELNQGDENNFENQLLVGNHLAMNQGSGYDVRADYAVIGTYHPSEEKNTTFTAVLQADCRLPSSGPSEVTWTMQRMMGDKLFKPEVIGKVDLKDQETCYLYLNGQKPEDVFSRVDKAIEAHPDSGEYRTVDSSLTHSHDMVEAVRAGHSIAEMQQGADISFGGSNIVENPDALSQGARPVEPDPETQPTQTPLDPEVAAIKDADGSTGPRHERTNPYDVEDFTPDPSENGVLLPNDQPSTEPEDMPMEPGEAAEQAAYDAAHPSPSADPSNPPQ